jgi:hypothetical protein
VEKGLLAPLPLLEGTISPLSSQAREVSRLRLRILQDCSVEYSITSSLCGVVTPPYHGCFLPSQQFFSPGFFSPIKKTGSVAKPTPRLRLRVMLSQFLTLRIHLEL